VQQYEALCLTWKNSGHTFFEKKFLHQRALWSVSPLPTTLSAVVGGATVSRRTSDRGSLPQRRPPPHGPEAARTYRFTRFSLADVGETLNGSQ